MGEATLLLFFPRPQENGTYGLSRCAVWEGGEHGILETERPAIDYYSYKNCKMCIYLLLGSDAPTPTQIKVVNVSPTAPALSWEC